jgi:hypothetical protein
VTSVEERTIARLSVTLVLVALVVLTNAADSPARVSTSSQVVERRDSTQIAVVRALFDSLVASHETRIGVRTRHGAPQRVQTHYVRDSAAAARWNDSIQGWVEAGDSIIDWAYSSIEFRFRVSSSEGLMRVVASPSHPPVARLLRGLVPDPTVRTGTQREGFSTYLRTGKDSQFIESFTLDSSLTLHYVRDTLRRVIAVRGLCPPGEYC